MGNFMKITQNVYWFVTAIAYACAIVLLGACGASMPSKPVHGEAAGQWFVQLPTAPSPFAAMAYGKDGAGEAAKVARKPPQLDAYLKPEYRGPTHALKAPRVTEPAPMAAVKTSAPMLEAKTGAPEPAREARAVARAEPVTVAPAAPSDVERYARRDATSQTQQNFKAGDVLVISLGSILLVVLIVVLLILLLR
jgi:hypothetical protein